jgi:O-antigen ligase
MLMGQPSLAVARPDRLGWSRSGWRPALAAVLAGLLVGAAAAQSVTVALALAVILALALACAVRSSTLLLVMVASVFTESVTLGGTDIGRVIAPVALFALVVAMARGTARLRYGKPLAWVCAYSLWAIASGLWTVNVGATATQIASLAIALVYMLAFAAWISSRADLERVLTFLVVASCAVGLYAIASYLGHGSADMKDGRVSGGSGDPNFFAAYQVVAIPLILVLAGAARSRGRRIALYIAATISIASVLTTLSRGGLIALVVVVVLTLLLPSRALFRSRAQKATVTIAFLLIGGLVFQGLSGSFAPRLNSLLSQGGGSGRIVLWQGAITAIKERPLTGLGYGAYRSSSNQLILHTPGATLQFFDLQPGGQVAHNAYLGTWAELGLVGLVLFLGLLISTALSLRRSAARARARGAVFISQVANALIVGLGGWVIASVFLSSETSRPLWVVIGITLALPKLIDREQAEVRPERPTEIARPALGRAIS